MNGELLTSDQYEAQVSGGEVGSDVMEVRDWEADLAVLAEKPTQLRVPRTGDLSRKQVVNAFMNAFELIGGTPRLALWANDNPSDFYKLYARLLPSQASQALGESNELVIKHVLPRGPLDD